MKRTDLALLSLDARRRTITCRLVEVKCYGSLEGLSAYEQLKSHMIEQIDRSQTVLAEHFDPHRSRPDRPDRAVRNAELATLLHFYVGRAVRHGTMRPDAAAEARWLLDRLDAGYRLEFTRTGLIFDLSGRGTGSEHEAGVEFHRIGRDLAEELLDAVPTDQVPAAERASSLSSLDLTVPRLHEAAFRAPARRHDTPTSRSGSSRTNSRMTPHRRARNQRSSRSPALRRRPRTQRPVLSRNLPRPPPPTMIEVAASPAGAETAGRVRGIEWSVAAIRRHGPGRGALSRPRPQ